jgi:hypothetical protein
MAIEAGSKQTILTYMHVHHLSITPLTAHNSRDHDELVLVDEIAYTSLILPADSGEVESQGGGDLNQAQQENRED